MPIKGLTDRGLAFPEIGQIRKGAPKGEKAPGKDLPYFRITFDEREQEAAANFKKVYGEQPADIRVILPFNEIERMWDPYLEAYTAGRLVARSDGEKFIYWVDTKTGDIKVKNGQPYTPYTEDQVVGHDYQGKPIKCKPTGRLKVIVPELARAAYMTVLTTSIHDIGNLSAQLEAFKRLNHERIAGIPLVLRRRPKKISMPKGNQRVRVTKWMLSIEADPEWVRAMLTEVKRAALPGNGLALLPEPQPAEGPEWEGAEIYDDDGEDDDIPSDPVMDEPPQPEEPEMVIEGEIAPVVPANGKMGLESAMSVKNSKGEAYGGLDTDTLSFMANSISKKLKMVDLPQEKRDTYEYKRDAIAVILASRQPA